MSDDDWVEVECHSGGPAHFDCGLCAGSGALSLKPVGPDAVALRVGRAFIEERAAKEASKNWTDIFRVLSPVDDQEK